mmetsp:Transcript_15506/g.19523  ORF Transcript_15506/g.19523 Transcript_15506/m.19523 type:complete len:105 (+) Transcript_15506:79-393(+)
MNNLYDRLKTMKIVTESTDLAKVVKLLDENPEAVAPKDAEEAKAIEVARNRVMRLFFKTHSMSVSDRLSMLQLHINVSLVNHKPQQMLLSLVTPFNLGILLRML